MSNCLFCVIHEPERLIAENELVAAYGDLNPASQGHTLVFPKRHILSWFELSHKEVVALHEMTKRVRTVIDEAYHPDGYTIGVNEGEAAGRVVNHLHMHIIPRYKGDVADPRGGIRHIIPGSGHY